MVTSSFVQSLYKAQAARYTWGKNCGLIDLRTGQTAPKVLLYVKWREELCDANANANANACNANASNANANTNTCNANANAKANASNANVEKSCVMLMSPI